METGSKNFSTDKSPRVNFSTNKTDFNSKQDIQMRQTKAFDQVLGDRNKIFG